MKLNQLSREDEIKLIQQKKGYEKKTKIKIIGLQGSPKKRIKTEGNGRVSDGL